VRNNTRTLEFNFQTARIVIASRAKQSIVPRKERMDCFAALAMTARQSFAFPRRDAPELWIYFRPTEGVGNAGRRCTRSLAGRRTSHTSRSHHRFTGITRHSRTQWFYQFASCSPRRSGSFATVASAKYGASSPVGP
jgi:hypothetical protein